MSVYVDQSGTEVNLASNLPGVGGNPTTFNVNDSTDLRIEMADTTKEGVRL